MKQIETQAESQAVAVRQPQEVGRALTASEISERLRFIKQVMADNMTDGVDYGKVPGCGDKPGLFQPGAQKLSMTFQLNPEVAKEEATDYQNFHRGYRLVVRVSNGNKFAEGVGECSTLEAKYRYRTASKSCPSCGKATVFKDKSGNGWYCWAKKGGCGAQFVKGSTSAIAIEAQNTEKTEHDNPADNWNTVRKMAFKRAFVHAIINATNTSELWSQDLEDLHGNAASSHGDYDDEFSGKDYQRVDAAPSNEDSGYLPKEPNPTGAQPACTVPNSNPAATQAQKDRMLRDLIAHFGDQKKIHEYAVKASILAETQTLLDWPLQFVPVTAAQYRLIEAAMTDFFDGGEPSRPFLNHEPSPGQPKTPEKGKSEPKPTAVARDAAVGSWRAALVPFGKNVGKQLGQLSEESLSWYVQEFVVTTEYNGRPKKPETIAKDTAFRQALNAAAAELGIES